MNDARPLEDTHELQQEAFVGGGDIQSLDAGSAVVEEEWGGFHNNQIQADDELEENTYAPGERDVNVFDQAPPGVGDDADEPNSTEANAGQQDVQAVADEYAALGVSI